MIKDLQMQLDQVDSFSRLIMANILGSAAECRISALVPLVKESWGIYRFLTSLLRALYRGGSLPIMKMVRKRLTSS